MIRNHMRRFVALGGGVAIAATTVLAAIPASGDTSISHTVVIAPKTNIVGCPVATPNCGPGSTPKTVTVSAGPDTYPSSVVVMVAECNTGIQSDDPAAQDVDPGLCNTITTTRSNPDGSVTQIYANPFDPSTGTGAPIKISVLTGAIGVANLGRSARPDALCGPQSTPANTSARDAQMATGRNCAIVVGVPNFGTGAFDHLGGATLYFAAPVTLTPTSGGSDVNVNVSGNRYITIHSLDPLGCALLGAAAPCLVHEPVKFTHGTQIIGVSATTGHGQFSKSLHIPPKPVGSTYAITATGMVSGLAKTVTYSVTS